MQLSARPAPTHNVNHLLRLASEHAGRGRYVDAHSLADSALQLAELCAAPDEEARARFVRSSFLFLRGQSLEARSDAREASHAFERLGLEREAHLANTRALYLAVNAGDFESAEQLADGAHDLSSLSGAIRHGYVGVLRRAVGLHAEARAYSMRAAHALEQHAATNPNDRSHSLSYCAAFRMDAAICDALLGDVPRALRTVRRIRRDLDAQISSALHLDALLSHYARLFARHVGAPILACEEFNPEPFRELALADMLEDIERVSGDLNASTRHRSRDLTDLVSRGASAAWDHVRMSTLVLARRVPRAPADVWLDYQHGVARVAHGAEHRTIDLTDRTHAARILESLISAGGAPIDATRLVGLVWPNERMVRRAADNRVRVAIATLRTRGLRDVVVTTPNGYAIAHNVKLAV